MADQNSNDGCGNSGSRKAAKKSVPGEPLISVIMAVLNAVKTIEAALKSVCLQDYRNWELIVIDGGSNDGTLDLLRAYDKSIDFWMSEPDSGIYDAWNKGLSVARGNWICFVGSDDMLKVEALSSYVEFIRFARCSSFDYISSRGQLVSPNGRPTKIGGQPWKWSEFKRCMTAMHVGSLHNRDYFKRSGFFDTSYKIAGDYELLLRARQALRAAYLDEVTVISRNDGISSRSVRVFIEVWRAKRRSGGVGLILCSFDLCVSLLKYAARRTVGLFLSV